MTPLEQALELARTAPVEVLPMGEGLEAMVLRTTVLPVVAASTPAEAPPELQELWRLCGGVDLRRDEVYGQGGVLVLSPEAAEAERRDLIARGYELGESRVLARYKGEQLWALLTSEGVRILEPLDPPSAWPLAAPTIAAFIVGTLSGADEKFWEHERASAA